MKRFTMKQLLLSIAILALLLVAGRVGYADNSAISDMNELTAPAYNDWMPIDDTSDNGRPAFLIWIQAVEPLREHSAMAHLLVKGK